MINRHLPTQSKAPRKVLYGGIILLFVTMLALPAEVATATAEGVRLVAFRLLPALFPFMVLAGLASESGFADTLGSLIRRKTSPLPASYNAALILGVLSGFPVGAKLSADLLANGELTPSQAGRLCALSALPSPPFLIAFVGSGVLGCTRYGVIIWLSHLLSLWIFAMLTRERRAVVPSPLPHSSVRQEMPISPAALLRCFGKAAESMLSVGATIIFFTIVARLVQRIFSPLFQSAVVQAGFYGLLELSRGAVAVGEAGLPPVMAVALATIITGWGGLAVHAQVATFAAPGGVPLRDYFRTRIICPPIAAILAVGLSVL